MPSQFFICNHIGGDKTYFFYNQLSIFRQKIFIIIDSTSSRKRTNEENEEESHRIDVPNHKRTGEVQFLKFESNLDAEAEHFVQSSPRRERARIIKGSAIFSEAHSVATLFQWL